MPLNTLVAYFFGNTMTNTVTNLIDINVNKHVLFPSNLFIILAISSVLRVHHWEAVIPFSSNEQFSDNELRIGKFRSSIVPT